MQVSTMDGYVRMRKMAKTNEGNAHNSHPEPMSMIYVHFKTALTHSASPKPRKSLLVVLVLSGIILALIRRHPRIASHCEWGSQPIAAIEVATCDIVEQAHQA